TENVHSEVNFIFLPATNEQDPPLVGRFEVRGDQTISVWESYMDAEISEDPETATNLFKLFKRRIRKAFPAMEAKMKEILSVENEYQGDYGWTSEVPEITNVSENFLVAPTQFTAVPGVARCVAHAYSVVQ